MKYRLVSGITATGNLTLGNYLGSIKPSLSVQDNYDSFIFVADLHALTIEIDPKELRENRKNIMAFYLACGINPQKSTIFFQSDVSEHSELYWLLQSRTTIGELSRMTQFKDKSKIQEGNKTEKVPTGLLVYPVLMAADILLYNPRYVTVGADQLQHLELTRNIAVRFNNKYNTDFILPEPIVSKVATKIMSLTEPTKKMSKSTNQPNSAIFLLDDPQVAYKKIQKAVTDSENKVYFDQASKPGISNLISIYAGLTEKTIDEIVFEFEGKNYGEFKEAVGKVVSEFLKDLQEKFYKNLLIVDQVAKSGAEKARKIASINLKNLKDKIGI
ncbi:tryptophan--tRNA ligase [Mesomycoplasma conjunctivae]|uniref:tryptophan--tRNA ligase n=1 Tax=Mesomycoplasma conjunctivae TaxID=45361 RepID=UPI003DA25296